MAAFTMATVSCYQLAGCEMRLDQQPKPSFGKEKRPQKQGGQTGQGHRVPPLLLVFRSVQDPVFRLTSVSLSTLRFRFTFSLLSSKRLYDVHIICLHKIIETVPPSWLPILESSIRRLSVISAESYRTVP